MLSGDPATGAIARHRASCPACQHYFSTADALETRLRAAAPRRTQPLPAGFEQRMHRALAPVTRPHREVIAERSNSSRLLLWSCFGTAAAAAALALLLLRPAPSEGPAPSQSTIAASQGAERPPIAIDAAAGAALLELAQEDPLQREINSVYADARGALQFLALNFLPESTITESPSS